VLSSAPSWRMKPRNTITRTRAVVPESGRIPQTISMIDTLSDGYSGGDTNFRVTGVLLLALALRQLGCVGRGLSANS